MKHNIQSVDVWQNTNPAATQLALKQGCSANDAYAFWDREGRNVTLGELQEMTQDQLANISSDMRISVAHINTIIDVEKEALAKLTSNQPMAMQEAKRSVRSLSAKKMALKRVGLEAERLIKERNREANKPKPKRERIITTKADLDVFLAIQGKMQYLRRKHLFAMIRAELGQERFAQLEKEASTMAAPELKNWASSEKMPAVMIERVINDNLVDDGGRSVEAAA